MSTVTASSPTVSCVLVASIHYKPFVADYVTPTATKASKSPYFHSCLKVTRSHLPSSDDNFAGIYDDDAPMNDRFPHTIHQLKRTDQSRWPERNAIKGDY